VGSQAFAFPQADTIGGQWVGLDATPTGTAAANDVVADFTGSTQTLFAAPSVAVPVVALHSQTLGSTFKPMLEGIWVAIARLACQAAGAVAMGVGIDNIAAELNTDPLAPITTRTLDNELRAGLGAGSFNGMMVTSGPIIITRAMVNDPTVGLFRVLASNAAGAGVAAASLVLNVCYFKLLRQGDVPAALRG
jgi:hypothetical protein